MEDGIETGNIVQYNLAVFVKPSSSTLNVDITPAAYWVTNADNTVRHNAAAGGSHFGYWYQMFSHPEGPNFDRNICPRYLLNFLQSGLFLVWFFLVWFLKQVFIKNTVLTLMWICSIFYTPFKPFPTLGLSQLYQHHAARA